MLGANQMGVTNGEKMNLQVGGPTKTVRVVPSHIDDVKVIAYIFLI